MGPVGGACHRDNAYGELLLELSTARKVSLLLSRQGWRPCGPGCSWHLAA